MSKYEIMGVVMSPGPIGGPFATITADEIVRDRRVVSRVLDQTETIHGTEVPTGSWVMSVRDASPATVLWAAHSMTCTARGGRWAVHVGGTVVRCRSKQHARRLARFVRGTVRGWRCDRVART